MSAIFSASEIAALERPHIARAWFGTFDFPDGIRYLHNGTGRVTVAGQDYLGVSDPLGGRLVSIGTVEEPRFGQAAAVTILLSGASREFIQSVHATRSALEGRAATIAFAMFDGETQTLLTGLKTMFPRGRMSSPGLHWQGIGKRWVSLTIENIWSAQNFAPGGRWSPAGQRGRFAGDKGLDFVGVKVSENWQ